MIKVKTASIYGCEYDIRANPASFRLFPAVGGFHDQNDVLLRALRSHITAHVHYINKSGLRTIFSELSPHSESCFTLNKVN